MSTEFNSFDEWAGHRGSDRRQSNYLSGWKKKGHLNAWLHTKRLPVGVWRHNFPIKITKENDDGETEVMIFGRSFVCHENEVTLKKQYDRDNDGNRTHPPTKCAFCKLVEWIYQEVCEGRIDWTDKVFEVKGADKREQDTVIHAGGIYNGFRSNNLSKEEKSDLKKHGIYPSKAWRESGMAKLAYVFPVVDNDNVAGGVQVIVESELLKKKVIMAINQEREMHGAEEGDPTKNPYVIRFVHREGDDVDLNDRYGAAVNSKIKLTDEIERLINSEPPDLSEFTTPFKPSILLGLMKSAAKIDFPWKEIFGDVEAEEEEYGDDDDDDDDEDASDEPESEKPKKKSSSKSKKDDDEDEDDEDDEEPESEKPAPKKTSSKKADKSDAKPEKKGGRKSVAEKKKEKKVEYDDPCEKCGAKMLKGALECTECGEKYEATDDDEGDEVPFAK